MPLAVSATACTASQLVTACALRTLVLDMPARPAAFISVLKFFKTLEPVSRSWRK